MQILYLTERILGRLIAPERLEYVCILGDELLEHGILAVPGQLGVLSLHAIHPRLVGAHIDEYLVLLLLHQHCLVAIPPQLLHNAPAEILLIFLHRHFLFDQVYGFVEGFGGLLVLELLLRLLAGDRGLPGAFLLRGLPSHKQLSCLG